MGPKAGPIGLPIACQDGPVGTLLTNKPSLTSYPELRFHSRCLLGTLLLKPKTYAVCAILIFTHLNNNLIIIYSYRINSSRTDYYNITEQLGINVYSVGLLSEQSRSTSSILFLVLATCFNVPRKSGVFPRNCLWHQALPPYRFSFGGCDCMCC